MKYQSFNSSCCYAGLANMLDDFSIDVEDRDIALAANLPYMLRFDPERNSFLAGAMLQGAKWFNLFLKPRGLHFAERVMSREAAVNFLASADARVMLGVEVSEGIKSALVFDGIRGGRFHLINNKWKNSDGSERFMFTAQELYDRLSDENLLGWVEPSTKSQIDFPEELSLTLSCIPKYRTALHDFCSVSRDRITLNWAVEPLFRPLLTDIPSMMELVGEARIYLMLCVLQRSFDAAFSSDGDKITVFDFLSEQQLNETLDRYTEIVRDKIIKIQTASGN